MVDKLCYYVSTETKIWSGAVSACSALGGVLATIESETIDTAIFKEMIQQLQKFGSGQRIPLLWVLMTTGSESTQEQ